MGFLPITDTTHARELITNAIRPGDMPVLTDEAVDRLVDMAASDDGSGGTHYAIADLNRVVSLGCQWKASASASQFEAGVGSGKNFKLNQVYDHWMMLAAQYASGQMSVVGSVDVDDGTGAPGRRSRIGSIGFTSVMNQEVV